jgi:hypothetical protein
VLFPLHVVSAACRNRWRYSTNEIMTKRRIHLFRIVHCSRNLCRQSTRCADKWGCRFHKIGQQGKGKSENNLPMGIDSSVRPSSVRMSQNAL